MMHPKTLKHAVDLCGYLGVGFSKWEIHRAIEGNDLLMAGFSRLLLLPDPKPLPGLYQVEEAWDYYLRNWRPGKPHKDSWGNIWAMVQALYPED